YSLEASAIAPGSVAEFIAAHRITAQTLELRSSWGNATGTINQLGRFNFSNALGVRSEEHTSELQSLRHLVCRLLLEKKKKPQPLDGCIHHRYSTRRRSHSRARHT